jgi:transcriptional regulator with XRE-family HTH domain
MTSDSTNESVAPSETPRRGRPPKAVDTDKFAACIGVNIRRIREKKGLTVEQCATAAGVAAPTWYHFESGRSIGLDKLPLIAKALRAELNELFQDSKSKDSGYRYSRISIWAHVSKEKSLPDRYYKKDLDRPKYSESFIYLKTAEFFGNEPDRIAIKIQDRPRVDPEKQRNDTVEVVLTKEDAITLSLSILDKCSQGKTIEMSEMIGALRRACILT